MSPVWSELTKGGKGAYRVDLGDEDVDVLQIFHSHILSLRQLENILLAIDDFQAAIRLPLADVPCT